ncbi:hypothetical protein ACEPAI_9331 [Sanghuangporus weigelae]
MSTWSAIRPDLIHACACVLSDLLYISPSVTKLDLSKIIDPPEALGDARTPRSASPFVKPGDDDDGVVEDEPNAPSISFIVAIEAWKEGKTSYVSESVSDILGFEAHEIIGTPAYDFCHPEDAPHLYRAYQEMISEDKAACLLYLRVRHKNPKKRFVLSSISCSRVGDHLIGAVSVASSATKAMHNASTAQEVIVIAPEAAHLEFRRWNDPPPITAPTSPVYGSSSGSGSPQSRDSSLEPPSPSPLRSEPEEISNSLHSLSLSPPARPTSAKRVAFVLDRFSTQVPVTYVTNDDIIPRSLILGRSFYDFVTPGDENRIRKAIEAVKSWGANDSGGPSDGGFAFNRFHMYLRRRDSSIRPEPSSRNRRKSHAHADRPPSGARTPTTRDGQTSSSHASPGATNDTSISSSSRNRTKPRTPSERGVSAPTRDIQLVDVIFSPQSDGIIVIIRPALPTG